MEIISLGDECGIHSALNVGNSSIPGEHRKVHLVHRRRITWNRDRHPLTNIFGKEVVDFREKMVYYERAHCREGRRRPESVSVLAAF